MENDLDQPTIVQSVNIFMVSNIQQALDMGASYEKRFYGTLPMKSLLSRNGNHVPPPQ